MQTIEPKEFLKHDNKFVMQEDVFLLYEDNVHFSLLVDRNEGVQVDEVLASVSESEEFVHSNPATETEEAVHSNPSTQSEEDVHSDPATETENVLPSNPNGESEEDDHSNPGTESEEFLHSNPDAESANVLQSNDEPAEVLNSNHVSEEVVPSDPDDFLSTSQRDFIDNLYTSLFPGEKRATTESMDTTEELNSEDYQNHNFANAPQHQTLFRPFETSTLKRTKSPNDEVSEGQIKKRTKPSEETVNSTLRRSNRIRGKQNTLDRLLQLPSKSAQKKDIENEKKDAKMAEKRIEETRKYEKEMAELDAKVAERVRRDAVHQEETEHLISLNNVLRKELSEGTIKEIFADNLQYFEDVKAGVEKNWRHKLYTSPGNSDPVLRGSVVGHPFSDVQQEQIYDQAKQIWLKDMDMYMENNFYITYVLLPTIFIRIYQVFMELESFEEAERRISNHTACIAGTDDDFDSLVSQ